MYVLTFPHFVFSIWCPTYCHRYGSIASFIVGITLRILIGEPMIGVPTVLRFPGSPEDGGTVAYPSRTIVMAISSLVLVSVSTMTHMFKSSKDFELEQSVEIKDINCYKNKIVDKS